MATRTAYKVTSRQGYLVRDEGVYPTVKAARAAADRLGVPFRIDRVPTEKMNAAGVESDAAFESHPY